MLKLLHDINVSEVDKWEGNVLVLAQIMDIMTL